jgi:hypothetical protein
MGGYSMVISPPQLAGSFGQEHGLFLGDTRQPDRVRGRLMKAWQTPSFFR